MTDTAALKEWGAAVHALLDGRQCVLLRKGGIHEKRFRVAAEGFLLFPTVAHSHAERVREEHRHLLRPAVQDSTQTHITVRASAKVVAAVEVTQPDRIDELADLHIWTHLSVRADRLDFRPKHRLTVLVVAVRPLVEPVRLERLPQYAGCKSWVELPLTPATGAPVRDADMLADVADRVRRSVS